MKICLLCLVCFITSVAAWGQSCNQYSLNFTASAAGDYFERAHSSTQLPTDLTVEAWVRITSTPTAGNFSTIVAKYDNLTNNIQDLGGYLLAIDDNLKLYGVIMSDVTNVNTSQLSSTTISLNTWTHVAMTYSSANALNLYINGTNVGSVSSGVVTMGSTANPLELGRLSNIPKTSYNFGYFVGQMDEVRIWNTALPQATIAAWKDFSATDAHPAASGMIANYKAVNNASFLGDSGPNSYTLTAGGSATYTTSFAPLINTTGSNPNCSPTTGLSLDGVDDYVDCGGSTRFNVYPLTASINVKFSGAGYGVVMSKYLDGVRNGWRIWCDAGHVYACYKVSNSVEVDTLDAGACNDGQWHHIAYVVDGTGGKIYLDGAQASALAWTGSPAACTTTENLRIGRAGGAGAGYFNGAVENASIYNSSLTVSTIRTQRHFMNTAAIAGYRFNNAATSSVMVDDVCNDYIADNAFLYGNPATVVTPASLGQFGYSSASAVQFSGAGYIAAEAPVYSNFSPATDMTLQFWFNTSAQAGQRAVLLAKGAEWSVELGTNNKLQAWFADGAGTQVIGKESDNTLRDGFWHHVAVVFKTAPAAEDVLLYVDGILQGTITTDNRSTLNLAANITENISFGATITQASAFTPAFFYSGLIDDASFYNVALTQAVINQYRSRELANTYFSHPSVNNMIGGFHFSTFSCNLDNDLSSQVNWLLRNNVSFSSTSSPFGTVGTFSCAGRGVQFFGNATSYAVFPGNSTYNFGSSDNYTVETWVKLPASQSYTAGGENVILEKSDGTLSSYYLHVMSSGGNAGKIHAGYGDGSWAGFYSSVALNDNKWHHLSLVKSGNSMMLYVDGLLDATVSNTAATNFANTGRVILGRNAAGTALMSGSVDEARIWNTALSAARIQAWYDQTVSTDHPDYASLVAEWTFDESSGYALFDASTANNSGELGIGSARLSTAVALNRPRITALSSNSGLFGTSLTISGKGLGGTDSKVYFGPGWANPIIASATSLVVPVPTAAAASYITVRPANGCAYAARSASIFRPQARCTVAPANVNFTLENTQNQAGSISQHVTFADKQGDGSPDMTVQLNNAVFTAGNALTGAIMPGYTGSGTSTTGTGITDEDFDGDGKVDFAYTATNNSVMLAKQTDAGQTANFTPQNNYFPGAIISDMSTGDVDGDGRPDLILATTASVQAYYNISTLSSFAFNSPSYSFTLSGTAIQTGKVRALDQNGDGIADILVAVRTAGGWTIRLLKGAGVAGAASYTEAQSIAFGSTQPDFEVLDYNNDGISDFAVNDGAGITLYTGAASGPSWFANSTITISGSYSKLCAVDINGDGTMELATAATSNLQSLLFFDASLTQVKTLALADDFVDMGAADMNRDELIDIVVLTSTNGGRYFYRNTSARVPVVTAIAPQVARIGETITITGTNFDAVPANNNVFFGGAKGTITAAGTTSLTVTVPLGVVDGPVSVTNGCSLTGYSIQKFTQMGTGCGGHTLTTGSFAVPFTITTVSHPTNYPFQDVQSADLNNDGKPDLIVASQLGTAGPNVNIIQNNYTSGTLSAASFGTPFAITGALYGSDIRAEDFDRDGKLDLAVPNNNTYTIFRNKHTSGNLGSASFEAGVGITGFVGDNGPMSTTGDMDGDGRPDLIRAYSGFLNIYRNLSSPGSINAQSFTKGYSYTFTTPNIYAIYGVAAGDLTGDGKPEIAVSYMTYAGTGIIFVFENTSANGILSFAAPFTISQSFAPYGVVIDDIDGDGKPDLSCLGGPTIYRSIYNSGALSAASFAPPVSLGSQVSLNRMVMADVDGDGKRDIVGTPNYFNYVWQNTSTPGNVSFNTKVGMGFNNTPYGLAVVDLDGDGKKEVVTSYNGNTQIVRNLSNKAFSSLVSSTTAGGNICDDGTWMNIYNPSNPAQMLMAIKPNGLNLGTVTANTYVEAGPGSYGTAPVNYYMARHYLVQTTANPVGNMTVRLYFTTAEFNALNAVDNSINTISDLHIFKYNGPTEDGVLDPGDATSKINYSGGQLAFGTQYGVNYVEFDVPSFSEFWITGNNATILPLRLLSFDARAAGEDVLVDWRTASERGTDYFAIERSTDGIHFGDIGHTAAKGEGSSGETAYRYKDVAAFRAAANSQLFYRLRQVDKNGDFSYSEVRKVVSGTRVYGATIAPNPANNAINIRLASLSTADIYITLSNTVGQVIKTATVPSGVSGYAINTTLLPEGIYYLKIQGEEEIVQEKVTVKH